MEMDNHPGNGSTPQLDQHSNLSSSSFSISPIPSIATETLYKGNHDSISDSTDLGIPCADEAKDIVYETEIRILDNSIDSDDGDSASASDVRDSLWAWVIVAASFMCNVIVDGIIFCFGVIMLEIGKDFRQLKGTTAWIGSLQAGFYLLVGPLVSTLANHYGCRIVTIIGSLIASSGFLISYFATSITWLCLSYGVLAGIGLGFIYLPSIVMVGHYFERRRAFATGIAVCGSGVGAFIMAPIIQYLNDTFHWRGCLLILSGIVLNCAVFGSLFRPLPSDEANSASDEESEGSSKPLLGRESWTSSPESEEESTRLMKARRKRTNYTDDDLNQSGSNQPTNSRRNTISGDCRPSFIKRSTEEDKQSHHHSHCLRLPSSLAHHRANYQLISSTSSSHPPHHHHHRRPRAHSFGIHYVFQNEILYSTLSLQEFKASAVKRPLASSFTRRHQQLAQATSSIPGSESSFPSTKNEPDVLDEATSCVKLLDLSLLLSPSFLLLGVSGFLTLSGFFIPFMYIVDRAIKLGTTPEKGALLLSIIGITNTVGRVFCGWISDSPRVKPLIINNIALITGGLVTLLSPLICNTFLSLVAYCSFFGFSIACFVALRSVITIELLGLERLTSAFGLLLLPQGIATIIGAPIAGWFFDQTHSYDASFYLAGSVIMISGIMCIPLGVISRWEKNRSRSNPISSC